MIVQIGSCKKLSIFSARDNQIKEVPEELGDCTNMKVVDLKGNCLHHLPISLARLHLKGFIFKVYLNVNKNSNLLF